MSKLCTASGCKTIVTDGGYRCAKHPTPTHTAKREYAHHYYQGKNIYWTNRWKRFRAVVLREEPLCRICAQFGIYTEATVVDHIHEIKDGGNHLDRDNAQSLCRSCHQRKTAEEAKKRRSKERLNGFRSLSDY